MKPVQLDDPDRTVEAVSADGVMWETTGGAMQVAAWLGNATEHDRQAVMQAARDVGPGECIRVSFTSVMTFLLTYQGDGVYAVSVPEVEHAS
jgi:hypothetical protein